MFQGMSVAMFQGMPVPMFQALSTCFRSIGRHVSDISVVMFQIYRSPCFRVCGSPGFMLCQSPYFVMIYPENCYRVSHVRQVEWSGLMKDSINGSFCK